MHDPETYQVSLSESHASLNITTFPVTGTFLRKRHGVTMPGFSRVLRHPSDHSQPVHPILSVVRAQFRPQQTASGAASSGSAVKVKIALSAS